MKKFLSTLFALILIILPIQTTVNAQGFEKDYSKMHSESIFMLDMETGDCVAGFNDTEERPMASLTKIMTYIVAYENIPNIEKVEITVDEEVSSILQSTGSSLSGVKVGETFTGLQLLNLMMIPSGNDAALVLAMYYDSTVGFDNPFISYDINGVDTRSSEMPNSPFVKLMNEKAQELGCFHTNFTNPHGLHNDNHYSTAQDMAYIAYYATKLPYFTEITNTHVYTCTALNSEEERSVYSTNKMFSQYAENEKYYYEYTTGIKTGSLNESGYCMAASASYNGYSYLAIVLGAPYIDEKDEYVEDNGAMLDAKAMFKWGFLNLEKMTILTTTDLMGSVPIDYSWDMEKLNLVPQSNVSVLLPYNATKTAIEVKLSVPEKIQAPISEGDIIGTATLFYKGKELRTINVVANQSVERSEMVRTIEIGKGIVTSPLFAVIVCLIIIVLILYIVSAIQYNKKKKKMRRMRQRQMNRR